MSICEDAWSPIGPIAQQAAGGAELVVNLNASPYYAGGYVERERMVATRAEDGHCAIVYVNQVGGQDELVFDGGSFVVDAAGDLLCHAPQFVEAVEVVDLDVRPSFRNRLLDPRGRSPEAPLPVVAVSSAPAVADPEPADWLAPPPWSPLDPVAEVYEALVLGTRDYVTKNGFTDVVIGLSGGIDSSLVAVHRRRRPRRRARARRRRCRAASPATTRAPTPSALADGLGIDYRTIPIEPRPPGLARACSRRRSASRAGLTEENLQPRVRGIVAHGAHEQVRAGWCSPPATRARWPSATRRSTATPPAASPSSRTCRSCWSTTCAAT